VIAVAQAQADVVVAQLTQDRLRAPGQALDVLDGVHLGDKLSEDCGLVSRAGADLEHAIGGLGLEHLGHAGHDVWLGDGLALANGHRAVAVGQGLPVRRNETMPLHLSHRFQHAGVPNAPRLNLAGNHLEALLRALRFPAALHANFGDFSGGKLGNRHVG